MSDTLNNEPSLYTRLSALRARWVERARFIEDLYGPDHPAVRTIRIYNAELWQELSK